MSLSCSFLFDQLWASEGRLTPSDVRGAASPLSFHRNAYLLAHITGTPWLTFDSKTLCRAKAGS